MTKQKIIPPVEDVKRLANVLEVCLESFGISNRVKEINFLPKHLEFQFEIARGVSISEIRKLSDDIALSLASPTGKVEVVAPIPGTSRIGINLPRRTEKNKQVIKESEPVEIIERELNKVFYIRNYISNSLLFIANIIHKIADKLYLNSIIIVERKPMAGEVKEAEEI